MKKPLLAALLLASMHAQAQTNISTIPTLKLFENAYSGGVSTQFYGEMHIPEPMAYHVSGGNGGKSFDFSLGWGHDTLAEAQQEARYLQSTIDQLAPVGERRASTAQVSEGYCAILTDALYFGGRWNVLGPGTHHLPTYTYARPFASSATGSFNDAARSVAIYKMIGSGCKPEEDIPMLLDANRRMYPLVPKDGKRDQAEHGELLANNAVYVASRYAKHYRIGSDSLGYMVTLGGGFSMSARTLTVPQCYQVGLTYNNATTTGSSHASFPPGTYTLANHGMTNGVVMATVQRSPGCSQAPRPAPVKVTTTDICIHPNGGSATPGNGTLAIYHSGCKNEPRLSFSFTVGGSLRQASSGLCLHPAGGSATPALNTPLVFHSGCDEARLRFELTAAGLLRHVSSGLCAIPEGLNDSNILRNPGNATRVVLSTCPASIIGSHLFRSRLNGTLPYHLGQEGYDVSYGLPN
ncbi:RICIN domain-containing protein [Uliginosibacterium sp. H1]|uniref:RICIN domain-containing protein n=1 Tax=Uliginosibacterium sp. H1 TaxID=3114757 RepID=UPI002E1919C5|nr:hypothetical protein [Uliginosibacterium sp. H1]